MTKHVTLIITVPRRVWSLEEAEEEIKRIDQTFLKPELEEQTEEDEPEVRWWERKALAVLDLSSNHLTTIPPDVKQLEHLISLDVRKPKYKYVVHNNLYDLLTFLELFIISSSCMTTTSLHCLKKLVVLDAWKSWT